MLKLTRDNVQVAQKLADGERTDERGCGDQIVENHAAKNAQRLAFFGCSGEVDPDQLTEGRAQA